MDVQPLLLQGDERARCPDTRRQIAHCLNHAFAVGTAGSFTTLLQAIANETGQTTWRR